MEPARTQRLPRSRANAGRVCVPCVRDCMAGRLAGPRVCACLREKSKRARLCGAVGLSSQHRLAAPSEHCPLSLEYALQQETGAQLFPVLTHSSSPSRMSNPKDIIARLKLAARTFWQKEEEAFKRIWGRRRVEHQHASFSRTHNAHPRHAHTAVLDEEGKGKFASACVGIPFPRAHVPHLTPAHSPPAHWEPQLTTPWRISPHPQRPRSG